MICLFKHWGLQTLRKLFITPCPMAHGQSRWDDWFFFTITIFFLALAKTLQESNPRCHNMLSATRNNILLWKKTVTHDFLLNFSCGTDASHQPFNTKFQHLYNDNSFPFFFAVGFQCNPPPQKQGASLCVRCELGERDGCQVDLQINSLVQSFAIKLIFPVLWKSLTGT